MIQIKHVVPYLPYDLKWQTENIHGEKKVEEMQCACKELITLDYSGDYWLDGENDFHAKPILRPMSDFRKEITINGKCFVAAGSMQKYRTFEYQNCSFWYFKDASVVSGEAKWSGAERQLELFEKLFEWHFDLFGLIEKGLAIDINTI